MGNILPDLTGKIRHGARLNGSHPDTGVKTLRCSSKDIIRSGIIEKRDGESLRANNEQITVHIKFLFSVFNVQLLHYTSVVHILEYYRFAVCQEHVGNVVFIWKINQKEE